MGITEVILGWHKTTVVDCYLSFRHYCNFSPLYFLFSHKEIQLPGTGFYLDSSFLAPNVGLWFSTACTLNRKDWKVLVEWGGVGGQGRRGRWRWLGVAGRAR